MAGSLSPSGGSPLLVKFETTSSRVKGLCFHPKRPWILASLHSGVIQLWDFANQTLVDKFEEHEGAVRGVDFHSTQPLFCSGGDDHKVKVWSLKTRRCLYTLSGHMDYVRTVQFHKEQPWIVSASDDHNVRVWNWQSRTCMALLAGHNHYVMSAAFHAREDYIVSASLDLGIRVWDIAPLRKSKGGSGGGAAGGGGGGLNLNQLDPFGGDVTTLRVLDGHERGVNWAAFHPTAAWVVSGSDDRTIRIWKVDESRAFEHDQLRGHSSNVSCVAFFRDSVVSTSEDRTLRVWDTRLRCATHTLRRETERFWILSVHPDRALIAAGHDAGFVVCKLERERPAMAVVPGSNGEKVVYVKQRTVRLADLAAGTDTALVTLKRTAPPPMSLTYSPQDNAVAVHYASDGGSYDVYPVLPGGAVAEPKKGYSAWPVFFARNKFAAIDRTRQQLVVRDAKNDTIRSSALPDGVKALHTAPRGKLLLRSDDKVMLWDVSSLEVNAEVSYPQARHVVWSADGSFVALLARKACAVFTRRLRPTPAAVHETGRIKSAVFDAAGALWYTTHVHLKYVLPNGAAGTVKALEAPIYLLRVRDGTVHFLDREGALRTMVVDDAEFRFKLALSTGRYGDALGVLKTARFHGSALVAYLAKAGFPDAAMAFVGDVGVRFSLAIECNNMPAALTQAQSLNTPDVWRELSAAAAATGDVGLAVHAAAQAGDLARVRYLKGITGQLTAGDVEEAAAHASEDASAALATALLVGDAAAASSQLASAGSHALALLFARQAGDDAAVLAAGAAFVAALSSKLKTSGMAEVAAREAAEERLAALLARPVAALKRPPAVALDAAWPLLPPRPSLFAKFAAAGAGGVDVSEAAHRTLATNLDLGGDAAGDGGDWGDLDDDVAGAGGAAAEGGAGKKPAAAADEGDGAVAAWDGDDLDFGAAPTPAVGAKAAGGDGGGSWVVPPRGRAPTRQWAEGSPLAGDMCAAGDFAAALGQLSRSAGVARPAALRASAVGCALVACAAVPPLTPLLPSLLVFLPRAADAPPASSTVRVPPCLPAGALSSAVLLERLRGVYRLFTAGTFAEAQVAAVALLGDCAVAVVPTKAAVGELREIVASAREYAVALRCERRFKDLAAATDAGEQTAAMEAAAYFTHYQLQPAHQGKALWQAMVHAFKLKCFVLAARFARRFLDAAPDSDMAPKAKQVVQRGEAEPTDALRVEYDERNPFNLCTATWRPIYRGHELLRCGFCWAPFVPAQRDKLCGVCGVGIVGAAATGAINSFSQL